MAFCLNLLAQSLFRLNDLLWRHVNCDILHCVSLSLSRFSLDLSWTLLNHSSLLESMKTGSFGVVRSVTHCQPIRFHLSLASDHLLCEVIWLFQMEVQFGHTSAQSHWVLFYFRLPTLKIFCYFLVWDDNFCYFSNKRHNSLRTNKKSAHWIIRVCAN